MGQAPAAGQRRRVALTQPGDPEGPPGEVITADNIREAYGVEVHVHTSSRTGTPMLLPLAAVRKTDYIF